MIQSKLTWRGDAAEKVVFDAGAEALKRIVLFFFNALSTALNVPNPGERRKRKIRVNGRTRTIRSATVYPHPSKPGEPPRKRTGHLQAGILHEFSADRLTARVGLNPSVRYGGFLEWGTRRMAARPWLLATLSKVMPQLRALAEQ
jgi:hypothetical protein